MTITKLKKRKIIVLSIASVLMLLIMIPCDIWVYENHIKTYESIDSIPTPDKNDEDRLTMFDFYEIGMEQDEFVKTYNSRVVQHLIETGQPDSIIDETRFKTNINIASSNHYRSLDTLINVCDNFKIHDIKPIFYYKKLVGFSFSSSSDDIFKRLIKKKYGVNFYTFTPRDYYLEGEWTVSNNVYTGFKYEYVNQKYRGAIKRTIEKLEEERLEKIEKQLEDCQL